MVLVFQILYPFLSLFSHLYLHNCHFMLCGGGVQCLGPIVALCQIHAYDYRPLSSLVTCSYRCLSSYCSGQLQFYYSKCLLSIVCSNSIFFHVNYTCFPFLILFLFWSMIFVLDIPILYYANWYGMKMRGSPEMRLAGVGVDRTWRYRSGEGRLS